MGIKDQLKKFYKQTITEAIIRSLLFGFSIGLCSGIVVFIYGIFTKTNMLWLGLSISLPLGTIISVLLYRFAYRPTIKKTAERIDDFGLEERVITMVELEDNNSYMAKLQREDAHHSISTSTFKLLNLKMFLKPMITLFIVIISLVLSLGLMFTSINAIDQEPSESTETEETQDDEIFDKMIDDLLSVISNAQIDVTLKNTLYTMVVDLERRLPLYDTYLEKYADVLQTRNEILQMIADAIIEIEESLINIAEALKKYENTEILGEALLTWDVNEITAAFQFMYDRIDILLGQELYDVMWQTAIDIETALAEAVGTDPAMHEALQALADAYKIALDDYQPGNEQEVLDNFEIGMQQSLEDLLEAVQALIDMMEELEELEEEIEETVDEVDEFPMFLPYPEDSGEGQDPGDPNTSSENTVIDGQTPYEDVFDSYYEDAMNWLSRDQLSEEMRRIIENYFNMLS